jgi:hypothetical protein
MRRAVPRSDGEVAGKSSRTVRTEQGQGHPGRYPEGGEHEQQQGGEVEQGLGGSHH